MGAVVSFNHVNGTDAIQPHLGYNTSLSFQINLKISLISQAHLDFTALHSLVKVLQMACVFPCIKAHYVT